MYWAIQYWYSNYRNNTCAKAQALALPLPFREKGWGLG